MIRLVSREEYEARIRAYLASNFPGSIRVTFDAAIVLYEDEYVEEMGQ